MNFKNCFIQRLKRMNDEELFFINEKSNEEIQRRMKNDEQTAYAKRT